MATVCIFLVLIGSCGLICRRMTDSIDRRFTFEITAEERYNLMVYFLLEHIDNHIVISGCSVVLCFVSFCRWYNNPYLTFPSVISQIFVPKQKKLAVKWITSVLKKKKEFSFTNWVTWDVTYGMYVYPDQEVTLRKKWHRLLIIINNSSISWNEDT